MIGGCEARRACAAARRVRAGRGCTGTVQGVGFRPFVYRLAHEHGLAGWVLNDEHGVLLEVEGAEPLSRLLRSIEC